MRLIDADALKEQCFKFFEDVPRSAMAFAQGQINSAPTIEAEPVKHGCWEEYPSPLFLRCSVCKCEYEKSRMPLKHVGWCPNPNCGAKMDGGVE